VPTSAVAREVDVAALQLPATAGRGFLVADVERAGAVVKGSS